MDVLPGDGELCSCETLLEAGDGLLQAMVDADCVLHDVVDGVVVERHALLVVEEPRPDAATPEVPDAPCDAPRPGFWSRMLAGLRHAVWLVWPERAPARVASATRGTVAAPTAMVDALSLHGFIEQAQQALRQSKLTGADPDRTRPADLDDDLGALALHVHALRGAVRALDDAIQDARMDDFDDVQFAWTELLDALDGLQRDPRHLETGMVAASLKRVGRRAARQGLDALRVLPEGDPPHIAFDVHPVLGEYEALAQKHGLPSSQ